MEKHWITEADVNRHTTEWNNFLFFAIENTNLDAKVIKDRYQCTGDLQSLINVLYKSSLLLQDRILRFVKNQPFYAFLTTMPTFQDTEGLHRILHQVTRQLDEVKNAFLSNENCVTISGLPTVPA